jgi:hypothetical protein
MKEDRYEGAGFRWWPGSAIGYGFAIRSGYGSECEGRVLAFVDEHGTYLAKL